MLKIYCAGKWKEREQVKKIMEMFEARGYTITCDWTKHDHPDKSEIYAQEDLEGVKECDVLVAYMFNSDVFYKGAWIEIGIALGLDKKVVIIGKDVTTVFLGLPNITVVQYKEEALDIVDSIQFDIDYEEGAKYKDTDHFVT